jgi:hypothetical protein
METTASQHQLQLQLQVQVQVQYTTAACSVSSPADSDAPQPARAVRLSSLLLVTAPGGGTFDCPHVVLETSSLSNPVAASP